MVSCKRGIYALSIIFMLLNGQYVKSADLGELQARKYINHLLDTLFIPHNHSGIYQQNLHEFSKDLTNDLTLRLGYFPHFYSFSKVYNDKQIYQEVINESLVFIEQSAHNYASNEIQTYYSETTSNQKVMVTKIIGLLMKEIKVKLNKASELPQGIFKDYYGSSLTTKIRMLREKEIKNEADRRERLNAKTQCSTCSVKFDVVTHKRITLTCGHTICLACLKELWRTMGSAISCNKCNAKINISDHAQEDWATPADDYYYDYTPSAPEIDYNTDIYYPY